ncbi:MAG: type II toxin-antitoxin system RatA family toxin [Caldimonas sp.]
MKHVKKSVLLWYTAHEIYELVIDVAAYPAFLPWCEHAEILQRDENALTARLHLAYSGIRHAFTTKNVQVKDESVHVGLVDGPFSLLDGLWRFVPLPLPSGPDGTSGGACKIEFELRYAFANGVLEAAISPVFDRIANTFVESFVKRAEQVYGTR